MLAEFSIRDRFCRWKLKISRRRILVWLYPFHNRWDRVRLRLGELPIRLVITEKRVNIDMRHNVMHAFTTKESEKTLTITLATRGGKFPPSQFRLCVIYFITTCTRHGGGTKNLPLNITFSTCLCYCSTHNFWPHFFIRS